jgi:hypothetical protein
MKLASCAPVGSPLAMSIVNEMFVPPFAACASSALALFTS